MQCLRLEVSLALCGALVLGCGGEQAGEGTPGAATSTSTTGESQSGSATSAPASASDSTVGDSAPTMATTTTTGLDTSVSISDGCTFLTCFDMRQIEEECDNFAQDCPQGQKCAAVITDGGGAWNALRCVEVIGDDEPGEPCTMEDVASGVDSCVKGARCWNVDVEGVGSCVALCTGSAEAPVCANKASCNLSGDAFLILCIPPCDPLLQDCPSPTDACYPVDGGFVCLPDVSGAEGQANDPCADVNACDAGLMCVDGADLSLGCAPGKSTCCTPYCQFPGGDCPNPDQKCVQFFDPKQLPPNDPQLAIGYCGVP